VEGRKKSRKEVRTKSKERKDIKGKKERKEY
jgi:hypothetical protein